MNSIEHKTDSDELFQAITDVLALQLVDMERAGERGKSATPQFAYNLAVHRVSSYGTHRVVTHSQKIRFSACRTSCY